MKHQLHMLFKTVLRQRLLMLATCLVLGTVGAWADFKDYPFVAWDETTGTLYFDCYNVEDMLPEIGANSRLTMATAPPSARYGRTMRC